MIDCHRRRNIHIINNIGQENIHLFLSWIQFLEYNFCIWPLYFTSLTASSFILFFEFWSIQFIRLFSSLFFLLLIFSFIFQRLTREYSCCCWSWWVGPDNSRKKKCKRRRFRKKQTFRFVQFSFISFFSSERFFIFLGCCCCLVENDEKFASLSCILFMFQQFKNSLGIWSQNEEQNTHTHTQRQHWRSKIQTTIKWISKKRKFFHLKKNLNMDWKSREKNKMSILLMVGFYFRASSRIFFHFNRIKKTYSYRSYSFIDE